MRNLGHCKLCEGISMEVFKTVAEISCDLNTVLNAGADIFFGTMFLGTIGNSDALRLLVP